MNFTVTVATAAHELYAEAISQLIQQAAIERGTGIAKRPPEYIKRKMQEGKAIIALQENQVAGFCYIETWGHQQFIANSGLIVHPDYRKHGLAKKIKQAAFKLSREKYPKAKLFGITTSLAVMKINSDLGYRPVTFSELTTDEEFWKGCQSCPNYDILTRNDRKNCLCTGMLYDPKEKESKKWNVREQIKKYERWLRLKRETFLKKKQPILKIKLFAKS
ncbi:MAG: GNAT family N-acetyltransferase [Tunicatimonas sp.]|uniref:GNAT family N-acetyltransferase n=1 Tax=Tunicatimonas sp. TaxID=1940096 RepID=UPI003C749EAD